MNHIMVVCDEEQDYASGLVDYLNLKEGFPFDVRCFSDVDRFRDFVEKQPVEVVLCSYEIFKNIEDMQGILKLLLLGSNDSTAEEHDSIWKYQSCEEIIRLIMGYLSSNEIGCGHLSRKTSLKMIGLYSPVKRCLQTTLGLTLGQLLSKRSKTLYVNLECCSGLGSLLNIHFSGDLSDIMYDLQSKTKGAGIYLAGMTAQFQGLDILPAMSNQSDLIAVQGSEWLRFFATLENETDYEYILLDLSDGVQGVFDILRQCSVIYQVMTEDESAIHKKEYYYGQLRQCGYEDVMEHIRECTMRRYEELPCRPERVRNTEFGEYVKELLKEEIGRA